MTVFELLSSTTLSVLATVRVRARVRQGSAGWVEC